MKRGAIRFLLLALADGSFFYGAILLAAFFYRQCGAHCNLADFAGLWPVALIYLIFVTEGMLSMRGLGRQGVALASVAELRAQFYAIWGTYLILFAYLSLTHQARVYSRVALCGSFALNLALLPPMHDVWRSILGRIFWLQIPVLIAGNNEQGRELAKICCSEYSLGFQFKGFLDDCPGENVLGTLEEASEIQKRIKAYYLLTSLEGGLQNPKVQSLSRIFPHILVLDSQLPVSLLNASYSNFNGLIGMKISNGLLQPFPRFLKSMLETLLAVCLLLLLWPLFLLLALCVKYSSKGPVFYRSSRIGRKGQTFQIVKFRTMYQNAEQQLEKVLASSPEIAREWKEHHKLQNDPRVTSIGRFLRKTSLDELPQLWNVLTGDMAIIGPRPIVTDEIPKYGSCFALIQQVRPGMTGLWQVSGRSKVRYDRRVALDAHYILNWSIWLDYFILLKTIPEMLCSKSAC